MLTDLEKEIVKDFETAKRFRRGTLYHHKWKIRKKALRALDDLTFLAEYFDVQYNSEIFTEGRVGRLLSALLKRNKSFLFNIIDLAIGEPGEKLLIKFERLRESPVQSTPA